MNTYSDDFKKLLPQLVESITLCAAIPANEVTLFLETYKEFKEQGLFEIPLWAALCDHYAGLRELNAGERTALLHDLDAWHAKQHGNKQNKRNKHRGDGTDVLFTSAIAASDKYYEEILNDGAVHFIDSTGERHETIVAEGITYAPLTGDELTEGAVLLPSGLVEYGDEAALIAELRAHLHRYVDVSPFFETVSAYYILLTWLYDELNTLPYLRVLGDTGTGKSRFLDVVGRLCYKATMVAGAITPAPIYRLLRKWHGTIIIDEGDFRQSDEVGEVVKILNCGFERGRPVVRCTMDHPDELQILGTFGPKIISSRRRFKDTALESRCITEIMRETSREDVHYLLPPAFYEEETQLRNKLLAFRFCNRGTVDLANAQLLDEVDVENRLKQATASFAVLLAHNEQVFQEFKAFLTAYNAELVEERSETLEGGIIGALNELVTCALSPHSNVPLVPDVPELTVSDVCALFNADDKRKYELNPRTAGKIIKTLGFTSVLKKTTSGKKRILSIDHQHLKKLAKKYLPVEREEESKDENNGNKRNEIKKGRNVCDRCGMDSATSSHNAELLCAKCLEHARQLDRGGEGPCITEVPGAAEFSVTYTPEGELVSNPSRNTPSPVRFSSQRNLKSPRERASTARSANAAANGHGRALPG